jgi:predicted methyltransferase
LCWHSPFSRLAKDASAPNAALDAAFANPDRPKADLEQDDRRQARTVLAMLDVKPGMHVMDVFSAGGYNTNCSPGPLASRVR